MNDLLIESIKKLAGKAQFASFVYTAKGTGEKARHTVILGANYGKLLDNSLLTLQLMPDEELISLFDGQPFEVLNCIAEAKEAVLKSLTKSIEAHKRGEQSENYTKAGQYAPLGNGLNINKNDNTLQLFCLKHSKVVIVPGEYKEVKSRPLTIAKDLIKDSLPLEKFREFALDAGNIHVVKLDNNTLILGDEPEQVVVISREKKNEVEVSSIHATVQHVTKNKLKDILGDMSEERHTMDLEL